MKKIVSLMLAVLMLAVCLPAGAEKLGEKVTLKVKADKTEAIVASIRNTYDKTAFEFVSGSSNFGHWGKNGASLITLDGTLEGRIGTLVFKILEDAIPGEYTFSFKVTGAYNMDEEKVKMKIPDIKVTVEDTLEANPEKIQAFVERCYRLMLNREVDPDGLSFWSSGLIDRTINATNMISGVINSEEYTQRQMPNPDTVEILYNAMLDRPSDEGGKAHWTSLLDSGCSENKVISGFCGSVEFTGLCLDYGIRPGKPLPEENRDVNTSLTAFVSRCYREALLRTPDAGGLNGWCGLVLEGSLSPDQLVHGFVFSAEMVNRNLSNEEMVETLYRLYLDREADPAGKAGWVALLDEGMPLEDLANGFGLSAEFAALAASYGL